MNTVTRTEYTTPAAATEMGISPEQFRRLAKQHGLTPVGTYRNPHHRLAPRCPLWSSEDVDALRALLAEPEEVEPLQAVCRSCDGTCRDLDGELCEDCGGSGFYQ